jgi:hypothetical protein
MVTRPLGWLGVAVAHEDGRMKRRLTRALTHAISSGMSFEKLLGMFTNYTTYRGCRSFGIYLGSKEVIQWPSDESMPYGDNAPVVWETTLKDILVAAHSGGMSVETLAEHIVAWGTDFYCMAFGTYWSKEGDISWPDDNDDNGDDAA